MKLKKVNQYDVSGLDAQERELFFKLVVERNRISSTYPDHLIAGDIAFREPARSKQSVEIIILGEIHSKAIVDDPWGEFMTREVSS